MGQSIKRYLIAKIGADTAGNERNFAEILLKLATTGPLPYGRAGRLGEEVGPGVGGAAGRSLCIHRRSVE